MKTTFLSSSKAWMALMVAGLTLFASCSKKYDPEPEPVGDLKILAVNAVNGSASQDLLVNGAVKASAVAYGNASSYATITSGTSTLGFYNTGTTTTMNAGGQTSLPIGAQVSVYYYQQGGGTFSAALFDDATANPTAGKAKVRFLHLNSFLITGASTATPITVTTEGSATALIPSLAFGAISTYFEVDPGAKFTFTGTGIVASPAFNGPIVAGKIYTIWIDGTSATNLTGHLVLQN